MSKQDKKTIGDALYMPRAVNDIAELTLARGDYQYGLGQIKDIAASALKGTEDA